MCLIVKKLVDIAYKGENKLVCFGVPLPKGFVTSADNLVLCQNDEEVEAQWEETGRWYDHSLRWLLCKSVIQKSGPMTLAKRATIPSAHYDSNTPITARNSNGTVFKHQTTPLKIKIQLQISGYQQTIKFNQQPTRITETKLTIEHETTMQAKVNEHRVNIKCNIVECKKTQTVDCKLRVHNPRAAKHTGGKWDLGDKHSVVFDAFSVVFEYANAMPSIIVSDTENLQQANITTFGDSTLTQYGSGGKHWQSPIHWDEHKRSTVLKQGFEVESDHAIVQSGSRASPVAILSYKNKGVAIKLKDFWQNFPVSVASTNNTCRWQLLASGTELQGGESKTWMFSTYVGDTENTSKIVNALSSSHAPVITYNPDFINQAKVIQIAAFSSIPSSLTPLINLGINSQYDFFKKRENKDVFGWRNFGEVDADHEAVNAPNDTYFISHYNNQYDPLMGMTLQYLHSGNPDWLKLVHPLSQHIQDIDIYDTSEDKAEYNGGLMWHTDHYLTAETCTHRSNSKYHEGAYEGFLGGGGPGGQHCYTTGLLLQYRLFGDENARQKVIQLCDWVRNFYNGSGSILERTFRLLTIDFKKDQLTNIGVKMPGYKYPLDRGIANYLNALIDCYDVLEKPELISEMGSVIKQTFHPKEDIEARDLLNIETAWFYTVFLQAVVRYLLLKEARENIDDDYWYARHGLMHYGEWMLQNEGFYLDTPEQLEFPNDTWCAQEVRKANLFYFLYYFSASQDSQYLVKADAFYTYIHDTLAGSSETHFTRILALLMQNDGVQQIFKQVDDKDATPKSPINFKPVDFADAPVFNRVQILINYMHDIGKCLLNFSIKSEWHWLSIRINSVLNK